MSTEIFVHVNKIPIARGVTETVTWYRGIYHQLQGRCNYNYNNTIYRAKKFEFSLITDIKC